MDIDNLQGDRLLPSLDDPEILVPIRNAVLELSPPGASLYWVACTTAIEWWLIGADGNLIEAFWLE